MIWRGFGSDNHAGAHPGVLDAIAAANEGHAHGYGEDPWTERATRLLRRLFGEECDVAFVMNGTGANCIAFGATCRPWDAVICPETAHINADECGAPERVAGVKLVPVTTPDGKLTPELVRPYLRGFDFEHAVQPRVISVSNVSEYGTVYSAGELRALADLAHGHGMLLHVDGARLANAAVALGESLAGITVDAGVDILSLGGTKNGMLLGEAVLLFGSARTDDLKYVRKQATQLASKMRFIAAQYEAMYGSDLWQECAGHANAMAARLADGARGAGVELTQDPQANEVFALVPREAVASLQERFHFYVWDERAGGPAAEVRWVTSWDTTADDIDVLVSALGEATGR